MVPTVSVHDPAFVISLFQFTILPHAVPHPDHRQKRLFYFGEIVFPLQGVLTCFFELDDKLFYLC